MHTLTLGEQSNLRTRSGWPIYQTVMLATGRAIKAGDLCRTAGGDTIVLGIAVSGSPSDEALVVTLRDDKTHGYPTLNAFLKLNP